MRRFATLLILVAAVCAGCGAAVGPTSIERPVADVTQRCHAGGIRARDVQVQGDISVGPVTFRAARSLADQPKVLFEPIAANDPIVRRNRELETLAEYGRLFQLIKQLVIVEGEDDVLVAIAPGNEHPAGLAHGRRLSSPMARYAVSYADDLGQVVLFEGCGGFEDYPGAVLTEGPQCLELDVWIGDADAPETVRLPLGARCSTGTD